MDNKIKAINWKTYIVPLSITILLFIIAGAMLTNSISTFLYKHIVENSNRLAKNHMSRLSNSVDASRTIEELLDEKLTVAASMVLKNRDRLSQDFLEEMVYELKVDELHWYNSSGKIIYTNDKYLGWQAKEGHSVYDFMKGNQILLIEDIRKDSESDMYYKYAYLKDYDGEFVQVGILADNIQELTSKFSPQTFIDALVMEEDILHIRILDDDCNLVFCGHETICKDETKSIDYKLNDMEKAAIRENRKYYSRKHIGNTDVYEVLLPIYVDNMKMGTLVITYSLESANMLIKKVVIIALLLLFLIFGVYGIMVITIIKKNRKIERIAYYDPVTNFLNKNYLMEFLEYQLKNKIGNNRALLLISCGNLNLLKLISGYKALDKLLVEKANRLRNLDIMDGHLFRYSENTLIIHIDNYSNKSELIDLSNEIFSLLEKGMEAIDNSDVITTRIGILELTRDYKNVDDLIKNIEIITKELQQMEHKKYCCFDESMKKDLILNETMEEELRKAIYGGQMDGFYLEYQPQVDLKTNKIIGLEALARWNSKALGLVPPSKFIDIAEKYQLIIPLGEWVLITACNFIKELEDMGYKDIKVAVNVSVIQLLQDNFVETLMDIIKRTGIKPKNLELEITESNLMNNYEIINEKLKILKDEGISISLDDFGTGYSSLSRLRNLNIDIIKIDRSFINNISKPNQEDIFIKSIITLADQLELKTIAEGVEKEEQREYLLINDCDIMQGYLFSKPISKDEVIKLL